MNNKEIIPESVDHHTPDLADQINDIMTLNITHEMKINRIVDLIHHQLDNQSLSKAAFLDKLSKNHNLLSAEVVRRLIEDSTISIDDLLNINIDREIIERMMSREYPAIFPTPERLDRIHKQSTEIYFWGLPSSGKSCALGALLSEANRNTVARSMHPDVASQGYGYMHRLSNLFQRNEICNLLNSNAITDFYEMGFDLVDEKNRNHPITFIEMAGGLMPSMLKANALAPMAEIDKEMLETLDNLLINNRTTSRKIHIFVVEYGAESLYYEGLPQLTYLQNAVSYLHNNDLFRRDTDSIYIMVTKADKAEDLSLEAFKQYIEENFRGLYNTLEHICRANEINGGRVGTIVFSIGDVYFQNFCKFDPRPAETVLHNVFLNTSADPRTGFWTKILKSFRN